MLTYAKYGMKSLALTLAWILFCQGMARPVRAQETQAPAVTRLNIVVVEGEGAIDNAQQGLTTQPVVRVEDENQKPVAGAAVLFALPTEGSTGVFSNGTQTLMINTDRNGIAAVKGMRANRVSGKLVIHVIASYRGLSARAEINQTIEGVPGAKSSTGGHHTTLIVVLAVVAAAGAGGAYFALRKSGSSNPSTPPNTGSTATAIGLSPGSGTIIGPH